MVNLILHYLLGLPDIVNSVNSESKDSVSAARKRKSLDLATMMASKGGSTADPLLFNLVDLILSCLRSQNNQTVYVTLQLVSVILKRHHRYAVITLLYTEGVLDETLNRTSGAHQQEVEYFMTLAGTIGGMDNFEEMYDNILKDIMVRLENHPCSIKLITPKTSTYNHKLPPIPDTHPGAPRDVRSHTLHPSDPLLNIVLDRLETFFVNPVEINLALTDAIIDLASCGYMHLEGWFLRHPQNYVYEEDDTSPPLPDPPLDPDSQEYIEYKQLQSMQECRRRPRWIQSSLPRLLKILQTLCDQVAAYRRTVPRFDDLLQQRREAFQIADCVSQPLPSRGAGAPSAIDRSATEESRNVSRERPSGLESFAQRIWSEISTPTRSGSPRGRRETVSSKRSDRSVPTPLGANQSPLRTPSTSQTRPYTSAGPAPSPPLDLDHNVAKNTLNIPHSLNPIIESQARAFQALDQTILSRRVGLPKTVRTSAAEARGRQQVEPVVLNFDRSGASHASHEEFSNTDEEDKGEDGAGADALLAPSEDEQPDNEPRGSNTSQGEDNAEGEGEEKTATVSHILTNVIILQSFLFELAGLVQVRAGLFEEVRFA